MDEKALNSNAVQDATDGIGNLLIRRFFTCDFIPESLYYHIIRP